jgi:hypothetical protein
MHLFAPASFRRARLAIAAAAFLILASTSISAQDDPPAQAGRLSFITGNVSIQQVGSDDGARHCQISPWVQATVWSQTATGARKFRSVKPLSALGQARM